MTTKTTIIGCSLTCIAMLLTHQSIAKDIAPRFSASLLAETLAAGDLNIDDELLLGVALRYDIKQTDHRDYFIEAGLKTDTDNEGSSVDIASLGVGIEQTFAPNWRGKPYARYSLGVARTTENVAINLIDRSTEHTFTDTDFTANATVGVHLSKALGSEFYVNQLGGSTTVGLSLSYSF